MTIPALTHRSVVCPACSTHSTASSVATPPTATQWTFADFRPGPTDLFRTAFAYHICYVCGYTATHEKWMAPLEPLTLEPGMRQDLAERTAPIRERIMTAFDFGDRAMLVTEAEYITLEVTGESPLQLGYSALHAMWAADDAKDSEAGRYWRRIAVNHLQTALDSLGMVPADEEATVTYLAGELSRALGQDARAQEWFQRVPDVVSRTQYGHDTMRYARQQCVAPRDLIYVAPDAMLPPDLVTSDTRPQAPGASQNAS